VDHRRHHRNLQSDRGDADRSAELRSVLCYNNIYYDSGFAPYAVDYLGVVFNVPGMGDVNLCSYTAAGACGTGGYASILWDGGG